MRPILVFVYNADSGLFNTVTDIAHKIFAPQSYSCNLCALTYGNFAMRAEWKAFLESLDADFEFLHRDELHERYGLDELPLPAILRKDGEKLVLLHDAAAINACGSLDELKQLLHASLPKG